MDSKLITELEKQARRQASNWQSTDRGKASAAGIADNQRIAELCRDLLAAEGQAQEALAEVARLREAAIGLRDDLLERAEFCKDAGKVVCAGNGAWFRFNAALAGDKP
jgi:hypothetical protein